MNSHFEPLEDRVLFAKLVLTATPHSDTVALDVKNSRIWYTLNGVTQKLRTSGVGVVQLFLANGNDKLILGANAPIVFADCGIGDDTVQGGMATKSVTLLGGNGNDNLTGGKGNDNLDGGYGNDIVTGNAGGDILKGNAGDDRLNSGDTEFDTIDGGPNFDRATLDTIDAFQNVESRSYPTP